MKKILYIDMDGVIVDFASGIEALTDKEKQEYEGRFAQCPNIFSKMIPSVGALDAVKELFKTFDVYVLSSAGWGNSSAWSQKYDWIVTHLPYLERRLILSSQKHLNAGDYIIDDRLDNGVSEFKGEHINFGTELFPDWNSVLTYLRERV
jgi:5'(3')-deoxyribonucleotidase